MHKNEEEKRDYECAYAKRRYQKHKHTISAKRGEQYKEDVYAARCRKGALAYYYREKCKIGDVKVTRRVVKELSTGWIPDSVLDMLREFVGVSLLAHFVCNTISKDKWKISLPGEAFDVELERKRTGVVRVYSTEPIPKIKKGTKRESTPRWLIIKKKMLPIHPFLSLITIVKKHRKVVKQWARNGSFPYVMDGSGRYWIPEFVLTELRENLPDVECSSSSVLEQEIRTLFQGSLGSRIYAIE